MKIYLNEISNQEKEVNYTQADEWVLNAVQRVDEHLDETKPHPKTRPIHVHISMRKVDDVFIVSGKLDTHIELICSRCANGIHFPCRNHFSALFCKDPVLAGVGHLQRQGTDPRAPGKPMGQNQGYARHAHDSSDDEADDILTESKDLDITYLSHDYIDLSDVLTEQLQLQVPFQPLCQEACKGMCSHCGADLNKGQCACSKIGKQTPFSVLSDFKL